MWAGSHGPPPQARHSCPVTFARCWGEAANPRPGFNGVLRNLGLPAVPLPGVLVDPRRPINERLEHRPLTLQTTEPFGLGLHKPLLHITRVGLVSNGRPGGSLTLRSSRPLSLHE